MEHLHWKLINNSTTIGSNYPHRVDTYNTHLTTCISYLSPASNSGYSISSSPKSLNLYWQIAAWPRTLSKFNGCEELNMASGCPNSSHTIPDTSKYSSFSYSGPSFSQSMQYETHFLMVYHTQYGGSTSRVTQPSCKSQSTSWKPKLYITLTLNFVVSYLKSSSVGKHTG